MADKEPSLKTAVIQWVLKSFSFTLLLLCFFLSNVLAILEFRFVAPLEHNEALALIATNFVVVLLIAFCIKHFLQQKTNNPKQE